MSELTLLPAELEAAWTAEIEWRGGPHGGRFCAVARRADRASAHMVAESAPVAWPPAGPAGVEALTSAHRALDAALAKAGWKPLSPGSAWYATRFAWEPVTLDGDRRAAAPPWAPPEPPEEPPAGADLFAPAPAWPEDSRQLWRSEIRWDAGWIDSRFQAVAYRPRGRRGRAIGASGPIKRCVMGRPEPDRPMHREAVRDLASALETVGWERAGRGAEWYSERFWWRHESAPAERLDPAFSGGGPERGDDPVSETGSPARIRPQ